MRLNPFETCHQSVMREEVLQALAPCSGGHYLDATLGGGGHSLALLEASAPDGTVLSLDVDPSALARARALLPAYGGRWQIAEANFRDLRSVAEASGLAPFQGILFDLGISSDQLNDSSFGLSFQIDGPLDMRLGPCANRDGLTADTIINRWSEADLTRLLHVYGEERHARAIAREIVRRRKQQPFKRTKDLADTISGLAFFRTARRKIHPATKTFQALRIAVNDELESLRIALRDAEDLVAPGGVIAVISFHSLEDRIVKQTFKQYKTFFCSKKPLCPTTEEISKNPRSRSAKLRIAQQKERKNKLCHEDMRWQ